MYVFFLNFFSFLLAARADVSKCPVDCATFRNIRPSRVRKRDIICVKGARPARRVVIVIIRTNFEARSNLAKDKYVICLGRVKYEKSRVINV